MPVLNSTVVFLLCCFTNFLPVFKNLKPPVLTFTCGRYNYREALQVVPIQILFPKQWQKELECAHRALLFLACYRTLWGFLIFYWTTVTSSTLIILNMPNKWHHRNTLNHRRDWNLWASEGLVNWNNIMKKTKLWRRRHYMKKNLEPDRLIAK